MGKGKRSKANKQNAASADVFSRSNRNAKKKQTSGNIIANISLILVGVLVVCTVGWSILDMTGVVDLVGGLMVRDKVVAESDNFQVTGSELAAYEFQAAQVYNQQAQTEYLYYQWGITEDTYGVTKQFSSAEQYASYLVNYYREEGVLKEAAYGYAEEYLTFCEGAKEAGKTLDSAEITEKVDDYFAQLQAVVDESKAYKTVASYIKKEFGPAVRESDVRSAMQKYFLYASYADELEEKFSDGMTDEELEKYRDDNMATFFTSVYTNYVVAKELKDAAAACTSADDIKALLCDNMVEKKFEELYKTYITDKNVALPEAEDAKATLKADIANTVKSMIGLEKEAVFTEDLVKKTEDEALKAYYQSGLDMSKVIKTSTEVETAKIKTGASEKYTDPKGEKATDLQKWLFAADRKAGDSTVIETTKTNEDGDKTSTYTLYVVEEAMKLDTAKKRHAGYVLFSDSTKDATDAQKAEAAQKKADAFLAALKAGEINEDTFTELAKEHSTSTTFFYDLESTSSPTSVSEWLFKAERKVGDVEIVSDKNDRYVVYYEEENEENWKASVRSTLTTEKLTEWAKTTAEKYNVTSHHGHDHEETTSGAESTSA